MNERTKKLIEFLLKIEKLKSVKRTTIQSDKKARETTPEHIWHMCMYAWLLEKELPYKIDLLKTFKMVFVHDLIEIYAGDVCIWDVNRDDKKKKELEEKAAKKLFNELPEDFKEEFTDLWNEFEESKTKESQLANYLDSIQAVGQHLSSEGFVWNELGVKNTKMVRDKNKRNLGNDKLLNEIFEKYLEIAKNKKYLDG